MSVRIESHKPDPSVIADGSPRLLTSRCEVCPNQAARRYRAAVSPSNTTADRFNPSELDARNGSARACDGIKSPQTGSTLTAVIPHCRDVDAVRLIGHNGAGRSRIDQSV